MIHRGVSKNRGKTPKMDGENNGKPVIKMDDLGVPLFLETPIHTEATYICFKRVVSHLINPNLDNYELL